MILYFWQHCQSSPLRYRQRKIPPLLLRDISVGAMDCIIACINVPTGIFGDIIPLRFGPLESDRSQAATTLERIRPNVRHPVPDRHRGQAAAPTERIRPDFRHAVRDRHRGQTGATTESIRSDTRVGCDRHRIRGRAAILCNCFCHIRTSTDRSQTATTGERR